VIDKAHGEVAKIDDIFVHPFFLDPEVGQHAQYDAAMVRVVGKLTLKPGFAVAKPLADESETYAPGEVCVLAGFGVTGVRPGRREPKNLPRCQ